MVESLKVSVITVVFNGAGTIEQTIKSVLGQTYKNIEYIIIDGDSTDGTQEIVEKYGESIACFVSEKDNGLYDAMNKGISYATGDIIGIINSDDYYAVDAVEHVVKYFEQHEVGVVYGKCVMLQRNGTRYVCGKRSLEELWYTMDPTPHPTIFVKSSVYRNYGMFDTKYKLAADYDLILRLFGRNVEFGFVDEVIAFFRNDGLSFKRENISIEETRDICRKHMHACSEPYDISARIEEQYRWACFINKITNEGGKLVELMRKYFREDIDRVYIFGAGDWGDRCCNACMEAGVLVDGFVDNDTAKWDTHLNGKRVMRPDELKELKAYVIIAIQKYEGEIKTQLERMENRELKYAGLGQLKKIYETELHI